MLEDYRHLLRGQYVHPRVVQGLLPLARLLAALLILRASSLWVRGRCDRGVRGRVLARLTDSLGRGIGVVLALLFLVSGISILLGELAYLRLVLEIVGSGDLGNLGEVAGGAATLTSLLAAAERFSLDSHLRRIVVEWETRVFPSRTDLLLPGHGGGSFGVVGVGVVLSCVEIFVPSVVVSVVVKGEERENKER